jgi:fatty acid desaturase
MAENKIIKSARKRYGVYIAVGVVMVAAIVATLITMGWFTIDDVNNWIALVVTLVVAIVGLGQSILSALNTDRDEPNL